MKFSFDKKEDGRFNTEERLVTTTKVRFIFISTKVKFIIYEK